MKLIKATEYILAFYDRRAPERPLDRFLSSTRLHIPRIGEAVHLSVLKNMELVVTAVRHDMAVNNGNLVHFVRISGDLVEAQNE